MSQERGRSRCSFLATMSKKQSKTEPEGRPPFDELRAWTLIALVFLATGLGVWVPLVIGVH